MTSSNNILLLKRNNYALSTTFSDNVYTLYPKQSHVKRKGFLK